MNTLPPPATPVTHSASTETSHSTLPGRSQALISVVYLPSRGAGREMPNHPRISSQRRETGNGSYLVAIRVLHYKSLDTRIMFWQKITGKYKGN
jgi:hypothetical protein